MNKQAFAFLTLFTLILMLSIYYVTLPADQGQLNPDQLLTGQNEDQDSLATMQQQLQDKHNAPGPEFPIDCRLAFGQYRRKTKRATAGGTGRTKQED